MPNYKTLVIIVVIVSVISIFTTMGVLVNNSVIKKVIKQNNLKYTKE